MKVLVPVKIEDRLPEDLGESKYYLFRYKDTALVDEYIGEYTGKGIILNKSMIDIWYEERDLVEWDFV